MDIILLSMWNCRRPSLTEAHPLDLSKSFLGIKKKLCFIQRYSTFKISFRNLMKIMLLLMYNCCELFNRILRFGFWAQDSECSVIKQIIFASLFKNKIVSNLHYACNYFNLLQWLYFWSSYCAFQ